MKHGYDERMIKMVAGKETLSTSVIEAENYTGWVIEQFAPYVGVRLLEVGIGGANYIDHLGWLQYYLGVDIDEELIENAKVRNPDCAYKKADLSHDDFIDVVGRAAYDSVICVNVLEHIEDDRAAVRRLVDALAPRGHLMLFVPAFQFLYTDLDRLAGHFRRYTKKSLLEILPQYGIRLEKIEYFNPVGGLGWWVQKFFRHNDLEATAVTSQVRIFDKYVMPIAKLFNPMLKGVFGQSVVCVVRKEK